MNAIEKDRITRKTLTDMLKDPELTPDDTAAIKHVLGLMGEG